MFLFKFNKRFTKDPENPEPAWRVVPREINLDSVFSIKEQRTVMADKYRISFAKAKVEVEKRLDGSIHIKYKDQYLNIKEISSDETKRIKTNTLPLENLFIGDIFTLHQG